MARKFEVGSFWKHEDIMRAAVLIKAGQPVGLFNRGACCLWGDPANPAFLEALSQAKSQPAADIELSGVLLAENLVSLIDFERIAERLRGLFSNEREIAHRFGSLASLLLPVKSAALPDLPAQLAPEIAGEGRFIPNWEPSGHRPAHQLASELAGLGVALPVFTPLDSQDKGEITDQYEGILFCEGHGIPLFLEDYHDEGRVRGGHTLLKVDGKGVKLLQEGTVPGALFDVLVGEAVDRSSVLAARPLQKPFPVHIPEGSNPQAARLAILLYLQGWPAGKLSHLLLEEAVFGIAPAHSDEKRSG
jgi:hypothetical protein